MSMMCQSSMLISTAISIIFSVFAIPEEMSSFEDLSLELSAPTSQILALEPLLITIALHNRTPKPIKGHTLIDPGIGFLTIYVAKNGADFEEFNTANWPSFSTIAREVVLEAGFHREVSGYLYYSRPHGPREKVNGEYLMESPGFCRIKAILKNLDGQVQIESNVITVDVLMPKGQDADAYGYLKALISGKEDMVCENFLLSTVGSTITPAKEKILKQKEEFLTKFPQARYARYVYYSLGQDYRQGIVGDRNRAVRLLEKAASYKDFFLAPEALSALIDTFEERGNSRKADKYRAILAKRFPENPEGRDYLERSHGSGRSPLRYAAVLVLLGVAVGTFVFGLVPRMRQKNAK